MHFFKILAIKFRCKSTFLKRQCLIGTAAVAALSNSSDDSKLNGSVSADTDNSAESSKPTNDSSIIVTDADVAEYLAKETGWQRISNVMTPV